MSGSLTRTWYLSPLILWYIELTQKLLTASPSAWQQTRERRHTLPPHFLLCLLHLLWICLWHIVGKKHQFWTINMVAVYTSKARKINVLPHQTIERLHTSRGSVPMFSIILGIRNTTTTMNPTMRPIGLFTIDKMEKGSRICSIFARLNQKEKKKREDTFAISNNEKENHLVVLLFLQWL